MSSAAASTAPSAPRGPMICRETGRPSSPRPMGIAQAGRPARFASNRNAPQSSKDSGAVSEPSKASQPTVGVSSRPERVEEIRVRAVDALALHLRGEVDVGRDPVAGGQERVGGRREQLRPLLERLGLRPARLGGRDRRPRRRRRRQRGRVPGDVQLRADGVEELADVVVERAAIVAGANRIGVGSRSTSRLWRSCASRPARVANISRASATERASGPYATSVFQPAEDGSRGTAPNVGLKPTTPQNAAGIRIEPPPSPPSASGPAPPATATAAPPDEPPGVRVGSCGFPSRASSRRNRTRASRSWRRSPRRRPRAAARRRRSRRESAARPRSSRTSSARRRASANP